MKEHSIRVQPIAEPVWLARRPAISPPFIVTPKRRKKTNHLPYFIQKMKAESINPAVIEMESTWPICLPGRLDSECGLGIFCQCRWER